MFLSAPIIVAAISLTTRFRASTAFAVGIGYTASAIAAVAGSEETSGACPKLRSIRTELPISILIVAIFTAGNITVRLRTAWISTVRVVGAASAVARTVAQEKIGAAPRVRRFRAIDGRSARPETVIAICGNATRFDTTREKTIRVHYATAAITAIAGIVEIRET